MTHSSSHLRSAFRPHRQRDVERPDRRRRRGGAETYALTATRDLTSMRSIRPLPRAALRPGAIVLARIPFAEGGGAKLRPAVIVHTDGERVTVLGITSSGRVAHLPTWIRLQDWTEAGLNRPSAACTGRMIPLDRRTEIVSPIGHLSDADREHLLQIVAVRHLGAVADVSSAVDLETSR